jgi:hypothetical protein
VVNEAVFSDVQLYDCMMFNLIVANNATAWETDQLMRMDKDRFGEYSGKEAEKMETKSPETLQVLENCPTFLMYEAGSQAVNRDMIRYGKVSNITVVGKEITFRFRQEGTFTRVEMQEFGDRLGIGKFEWNRTHWAVKDGGVPSAMLTQLNPSTKVDSQAITFFISHASEDKDSFVRPLAEALIAAGFNVWFDEYELTLGDSLLRRIDHGLKTSNYGIVVLSKSFFAKDWPQRELDGLFALETSNKKLILPVWLGVNKDDVAQFSPILAGRLGGKGDKGVPHIVDEIQKAMSVSRRTREVTVESGKSALQALTKKLSSWETEKKRLDSSQGAGEVTDAASKIVDEIVQAVEQANQEGKKRFSLTRHTSGDTLTIAGPMSVLVFTVLREIFVNTGERAEFFVRFGQGSRTAPHPGNVETLEEIIFVPRIVDQEGVKWEEKDGDGKIRSAQEAAGRIIERYVHHIDELMEN